MKFDQKFSDDSCKVVWELQLLYTTVYHLKLYKCLCLNHYFDSKVWDCDHAFAKFYAVKAAYDLGPPQNLD